MSAPIVCMQCGRMTLFHEPALALGPAPDRVRRERSARHAMLLLLLLARRRSRLAELLWLLVAFCFHLLRFRFLICLLRSASRAPRSLVARVVVTTRSRVRILFHFGDTSSGRYPVRHARSLRLEERR